MHIMHHHIYIYFGNFNIPIPEFKEIHIVEFGPKVGSHILYM